MNRKIALLIILVLALAVIIAALSNAALFEDGSVQFFSRPGWGFCLLKGWGC